MNKGILIFPVSAIIGLFMLGVSLSTGYPTWLDGNMSIECRYPIEINRSVINGDNDILNFPIVVNGINETYLDYLPLKDLIDDGYLDSNCNCLWIVNNISNDSIGLEWHFANKTSDNYGCYTNNAEIHLLAPEIPDIPYMYIDNNCGASSDTQNLTGPFYDYALNLHFAEETGSTTYGTSKYMNNGTLHDNTFFRPGKSGYSVMLDGSTGEYVKVNDADELDGFQNFTIEYWYNAEASQSDYACYFHKGNWNYPPFLQSYMIRRRYQSSNYYQIFITWLDGTFQNWNTGFQSETSGQWYHMVLTYDSYYLELWRNGIRILNQAIAGKTINASSSDLHIGGYAYAVNQGLNGRIDEFKIKPEYSREVEIKRAYEIGLSNLEARQCQIITPPPIYTAFSGKTENEYLIRANCNWQTESYCDMGIMAGYDNVTERILCCLIIGVE